MKNKKLFILLGVVLVALFLPTTTYGVIGTGFFDAFKAMHAGLAQVFQPAIAILLTAAIAYVAGIVFLLFAGIFLEQSIVFSIENLTINSDLVRFGWTFVVGIANMAIILALLIAGIALILKLENINPKKLITNAIIIALLMNFTLVFVGMGIDISNIFYRTILNQMMRQDPIRGAVTTIVTESGGLAEVGSLFATLGLVAAIPVVSPFAQTLMLMGAGIHLFPQIMTYLIQTAIFFLLGTMFFIFGIIFIFRVFVIQILAIMSPIAFACLALPNQKKHFDTWLNYFISWLLSGVVFLFLIAIGFQLTKIEKLRESVISIPFFTTEITLSGTLVFFIYLGIYFLVVLFIGKSSIPMGAAAITSFAENTIKQGAPKMADLGIKAGSPVGAYIREKTSKAAQSVTKKAATASDGKYHPLQRWAASRVYEGQLKIGDNLGKYHQEKLDKDSSKFEGTSVEHKEMAIRRGDKGALVQAIKEKQIDKMKVPNKNIINITKKLADVNEDAFKKIYQTFPHLAEAMTKGFSTEKMEKMKLTITPENKAQGIENLLQKIISKMKPDDIANMSENAMKDENVMKYFLSSATNADQLATYLKEAPIEAKKTFADILNERGGLEAHEKINLSATNFLKSNAGIRSLGIKLDENKLNKDSSKYEGTSAEVKDVAIRGEDMGALVQAIKEGQIDEIKAPDENIINITKKLADVNEDAFKKTYQTFPHLAEAMTRDFSDEKKEKMGLTITPENQAQGIENLTQKIISKMKPDDIANMSENAMKNDNVMNYFLSSATNADQLASYMKKATIEIKRAFAEKLTERGGLEAHKMINLPTTDLLRYIAAIRLLERIKLEESKTVE